MKLRYASLCSIIICNIVGFPSLKILKRTTLKPFFSTTGISSFLNLFITKSIFIKKVGFRPPKSQTTNFNKPIPDNNYLNLLFKCYKCLVFINFKKIGEIPLFFAFISYLVSAQIIGFFNQSSRFSAAHLKEGWF